jgi:aconitate hydratase
MNISKNSFDSKSQISINGKQFEFFDINKLSEISDVETLPFSIKILLENLLRHEDSKAVLADDIVALAKFEPSGIGSQEIAFTPERVLMQDFTGVPAVADLAAMRDAVLQLGGDPKKINPLVPVELVIDHSVIAEYSGTKQAFELNAEIEAKRNSERYSLLRWAQNSFDNFRRGIKAQPFDGSGFCNYEITS